MLVKNISGYCPINIPSLNQGSPGLPGLNGLDGAPCKDDGHVPTGHMLVRHSQSSSIPLCGPGELKLWDGYSLLYVEGNEKSHHQDLGMRQRRRQRDKEIERYRETERQIRNRETKR